MSRDSNGRFEKGFCGNPKGRPRKLKRTLSDINHEDEFIEATEEELSVNVAGKVQTTPAMDLIYKQLVRKAVSGDVRCMLKVMELRENYVSKHRDEMLERFKAVAEAEEKIQLHPEDYTDEYLAIFANLKASLQ